MAGQARKTPIVIGVNGFDNRHAQPLIRAIFERTDVKLGIINEPRMNFLIELFRESEIYGPWVKPLEFTREFEMDYVTFGDAKVEVLASDDPNKMYWPLKSTSYKGGVDVVVDFYARSKEEALSHLKGGANKVIIADPETNFPVYGVDVNQHLDIFNCPPPYDPSRRKTRPELDSLLDFIASIPRPKEMHLTLVDCGFTAKMVLPAKPQVTTVTINFRETKEVVHKSPNKPEVLKMLSSELYQRKKIKYIISRHRDIGSTFDNNALFKKRKKWLRRRLSSLVRMEADKVMKKGLPYDVDIEINLIYQKVNLWEEEMRLEEEMWLEEEAEKEVCVCSICQTALDNVKMCRVTLCQHTFHTACLWKWQRKKYNCPDCRAETHFGYF